MPRTKLNLVFFLIAFAFVVPRSAAPAASESDIVDTVLSSFQHNYDTIGPFKAKMHQKQEMPISLLSDVSSDASGGNNDPGNGTLRLDPPTKTSGDKSILEIDWTTAINGEVERCELETPKGRQLFIVDQEGVISCAPAEKKAILMPMVPSQLKGIIQFDPREIGFMHIGERLVDLIKGGRIESAKLLHRGSDEVAEIRFVNAASYTPIVVECSASVNFLPTRVYYIRSEGNIDLVTDITYQPVSNKSPPSWFLKEAIRRYAGHNKNISPDDPNWETHSTFTLSDLEFGRDVPDAKELQELPVGTEVFDAMHPATGTADQNQPESNLRGFSIVVTIVALLLLVIVIVKRRGALKRSNSNR